MTSKASGGGNSGGGGGGNGYAGAPKYINDFSKALAGEVRVLLAEVGQLRDERRALQYEIAELMSAKSKHGEGGEYMPEWRPTPEEPAPPPPEEPGPAAARPGWRVVNKRRDRALKAQAMRPPSPNSVPPLEPPKPNVPAWAQWRPSTAFSPAPVPGTVAAPLPSAPPPRSGIFGPPTPPPK
ncbi:hypothetical protein MIND_00822800 [Mycena indigotica]|uniref:Uncharacterized protein n=1 Tax=Mycena indigotica TaxID=2126181 RepID=A0A8H6SFT8_9AGAR|nr:uncharacterized protein MIND_00822800 [Mycena indigotica]KAF7298753.1 hypothetical protein MIND_00822800 [Mycena indigotica]